MPVLSHALPVHSHPTSFAQPRQQQATTPAAPSTPSTAVPPHYQSSSPLGLDAGPSTPWTSSHGYFDAPSHLQPPDLSPPGLARCSSEPPANTRDMTARVTASRTSLRTPSSLQSSTDSPSDIKSLPVTPKAATPGAVPYLSSDALAGALMASVSTPASPCHPPLSPPSVVPSGAPQPAAAAAAAQRAPRRHGASAAATPARSPLEQYTDLFQLEPHEYDSITDGELVRLYDRGILEWRVLEQIVDASIRIQRSCTDADRAVSIKIRRAMIRHALED